MMQRVLRVLRELMYIARVMSVWGAFLQGACFVDAQIARVLHRGYSPRIHGAKNDWVQKFLRKEFAVFIDEWRPKSPPLATVTDAPGFAPIWICWLQGERKAPKRVAALIENVKCHAGAHAVRVVDMEEVQRLVNLPEVVTGGVKSGRLRVQTLADVARVWLLQEYGGVWLDASVLLVRQIPDQVFQRDMWTAKEIELCFPSAPGLVDISMWQSYFIGSRRGGLAISFMRDFLSEYFTRYSGLVDYVLINHVAKIARDRVSGVSKLFDEIPANNELCESLSQYMLRGGLASDEARSLYLEGDTVFYKLSWSAEYPFVDSDGRQTFAGTYLRGIL